MNALADWIDKASSVVVLSQNGQVGTHLSTTEKARIVAALRAATPDPQTAKEIIDVIVATGA